MADCPTLINLPYGEFSEAFHDKVMRERIPVSGSLEITARCNLRCKHCYLPLAQRAGSRQGEMSADQISRIFGQIADAGCLWLLITGGEPLLRSDFQQIYDDAKRRGLIVTLFTNATLVDERIADHLAEWQPFGVEVSLYGATQQTYERVTGIPGSYARCMRGIELLLERKVQVSLKSVLLTLNQHELNQMQALCASMGVRFMFDPVINTAIDGGLQPAQYRLTPEEIVSVERNEPAKTEALSKLFVNNKNFDTTTRKMYLCGAGRWSFHIDAAGKLSLCISARQPAYDLLAGTFEEGWYSFLPGVRAQEYSAAIACIGCALRGMCPQCPAMGWTEAGDPERVVPFLCQLTHLRYAAFGPTPETNLVEVGCNDL